MRRILENSRTELVVRAGSLDALSPLAVLGRGYSIATNREGAAVLSTSDLKAGDRLSLRFYEGETQVVIEEVSGEDPLS
jgi:exodeoxyribonuclease VII large subunit